MSEDAPLPFLEAPPLAYASVATARSKGWGRGFPAHTTARLRNLGASSSSAGKPNQSLDQTVGHFAASQGGKSAIAGELRAREEEEEQVSHAVA
jgi:hypothetical protein